MILSMLLGLVISTQTIEEPAPESYDQLRVMIREKQSRVKSLAFAYEGSSRWVGPPHAAGRDRFSEEQYQGTVFLRQDGAVLCDSYTYFPDVAKNKKVFRRKASLLGPLIEQSEERSDPTEPIDPERVKSSTGWITSFPSPYLPLELDPTWHLMHADDNPINVIKIEGWEEIEGHRCLRVHITDKADTRAPAAPPHKVLFWIDMERDAHVIRLEVYFSGLLRDRTKVQLKSFPLKDGTSAWVPGSSQVEGFIVHNRGRGVISPTPLFERTVSLVDGSVVLNSDLPNAMFSVKTGMNWQSLEMLKGLAEKARSLPLALQFQTQHPRPADVVQ